MAVIDDFLTASMGQPIAVQIGIDVWGGVLFAGDDRHIVLQMADGLKLITVEDITAIDVKQVTEIVDPTR